MQAVWFNLCYYFGRTGREGWYHMSKSTFMVRIDEDDTEYVCMHVTESTKNHQESSKDYESNDVRMSGDGVKYLNNTSARYIQNANDCFNMEDENREVVRLTIACG